MKGEQLRLTCRTFRHLDDLRAEAKQNFYEGDGPQTILAEGPLLVCWLKIFHRIFSTILKHLDSHICREGGMEGNIYTPHPSQNLTQNHTPKHNI